MRDYSAQQAKRDELVRRAARLARGLPATASDDALIEEVRQQGELIAEQSAKIDALALGIAAAFEAAGRDAPAGLQPEPKRPDLKLIQGGGAA